MLDKANLDADRYRLEQAYRNVANSVDGEMVLTHIIQVVCGTFNQTLLQADSHQTAHAVGRRDVGITILNHINSDKFDIKEGRKPNVRREHS